MIKKVLLFVVPIIILVFAGVYFVVSNKLKENSNPITIGCVPIETTARNPQTGEIKTFEAPCDVPVGWESIDSTVNWKTYTNAQYGFTFNYPSVYNVIENNKFSEEESKFEVIINKTSPFYQPNFFDVLIRDKKYKYISLENTINWYKKKFDNVAISNKVINDNIFTIINFEIQGHKNEVAYIEYNGFEYALSYSSESEKILTSFNFNRINIKPSNPVTPKTGDIEEIKTLLNNQTWAVVMVMLKPNTSIDTVLSNLNKDDFQIKYKYQSLPGFAGSISKSGMDKLLKDSRVISIELDKIGTVAQ